MTRALPSAPLRLVPRRALKAWGEELWLDSTRPEFPAGVAGGGTLAQALRRRPQLLGSWSRRLFGDELPVFAKFIRTDFPPLAHIGFKSLVRPQEFLGWICREHDLLSALRRSLRVPDERAFAAFEKLYEPWAAGRALAGWQADPARDQAFVRDLGRLSRLDPADLAGLCEDLRRNRGRVVGVLNQADLRQEAGNFLMIKAGLIHALFGLSLQFHPLDPTQEALQEFILASRRGSPRPMRHLRLARLLRRGLEAPKSEAWLPLGRDSGASLAEVQQSSDTTFSVADFFTPFLWDKGARFRKGHPATGLNEPSLRRMIKALDFSVTPLSTIRCRPQALDPGPQARRSRLSRLLDRPALWPFFTVMRLDLAGTPRAAARWAAAEAPSFEQLVVLSGRVRLEHGGRTWRLGPRAPAFVPAGLAGGYALSSDRAASVLLIGVPGPR